MQIVYRVSYWILFILYLPKLLVQMAFGRKSSQWFMQRLFPQPIKEVVDPHRPFIWVHAVSVGEVLAIEPVLLEIRQKVRGTIVLSTVTETGMETAKKRALPVDYVCYLPFDFRFSVRRLFRKKKPDLVIFSEGDMWPEFIFQAKKSKAKVAIVNAKLSDRSFSRLRILPRIGCWLFRPVDLICAQNELYAKRFQKLITSHTRLLVTGNTKGDVKKSSQEEVDALKQKLHILNEPIVTVASSHFPEEQQLAQALEPLLRARRDLRLIVVPRHPHRFQSVFETLKKLDVGPTVKLSHYDENWKILVVDQMGLLETIYGLTKVALVCGSFVEQVGGHNVLEALQWGVPCVVGPYMRSQRSMMEVAESIGGILQVQNYQEAAHTIALLFDHKDLIEEQSKKACCVASYAQGSARRCAEQLFLFLNHLK